MFKQTINSNSNINNTILKGDIKMENKTVIQKTVEIGKNTVKAIMNGLWKAFKWTVSSPWKLIKFMIKSQKKSNKIARERVAFKYIGGTPFFNSQKDEDVYMKKNGEEFVELYTTKFFSEEKRKNSVNVKLIDYEWGESHKRSSGKAGAGAIVGHVVGGKIGTIAGAAVGGKAKDNSILTLLIEMEEGKQFHMQVRADQAKYNEFANKILSY